MDALMLQQVIKFNRPINKDIDHIAPGGYALTFRDGEDKKSVQFDFVEFWGDADKEDPTCAVFTQRHLDVDEYPDAANITTEMLLNIDEVDEWFVYTETATDDETIENLVPVAVISASFEVFENNGWRDKDIELPQSCLDSIAKMWKEDQ